MASPQGVGWDARGYHRVASVQEAWGIEVIRRIPPGRYEKILDAGCGSGRLTARLLRAFPRARLVGLDQSPEMLEQASRTLSRFRPHIRLARADLIEANPGSGFDLIFSNATLHWVRDHRRLFRNCYRWLAPGGWLVAQCGGGANIRRIEGLSSRLCASKRFAEFFAAYSRPVHYATVAETRRLLHAAGFENTRVWSHSAPARFPSRARFADFIRNVCLLPNLNQLPEIGLRTAFVQDFIGLYLEEYGRPFIADYVRLNIEAKKR